LAKLVKFFGPLLVFAFAGGHSSAQALIPVVHTWGDLQNAATLTVMPTPRMYNGQLPPILAPVTFQVGISGNEAASYGGLVLYFIAPDSPEGRSPPEERGLYAVEVEGAAKHAQDASCSIGGYPKDMPSGGTTFYAEAIPFAAAGDYVVKLVKRVTGGADASAPPQILAQVSIQVQDHPQDLWYPFWETENGSGGAPSGENADGTRYATVTVNNPKGGTAIPKPPYPRVFAQLPAPGQALPVLFPDPTDPSHARLKMTDSTLIVNFDEQIEGFFPDDNFLTRWWINGQPVVLDPKAQRPMQARALGAHIEFPQPQITKVSFRDFAPLALEGALVWFTKEVHFDLQFQPDWLGVKKGDRVGVQLLFCPHRFVDTSEVADLAQAQEFLGHEAPPPASFSELSNRIEFIYSGDPKHPQQ
jgi:hypothetical protein